VTVATIKTTWTGGPSSPGLTVMNVEHSGTSDWAAAVAAVAAFWNMMKGGIPNEYSLQVEPLIEFYAEGSGQLTGEAYVGTAQTPAPIVGTGAGGYAAGVGGRVDWLTSDIRNGRRVRGRTFMVPLVSSNYDANGQVAATNTTYWGTQAQTLIDALESALCPLVVWSRPSVANPVGQITPVIGVSVPNKAAVLRGRRD
jgi:hypothetical protein